MSNALAPMLGCAGLGAIDRRRAARCYAACFREPDGHELAAVCRGLKHAQQG